MRAPARGDRPAHAPLPTLTLAALPNGYQTEPGTRLSDFATVRIQATFRNEGGSPMVVSGSENFQLWADPSIANPPHTVEGEPAPGTYAVGDEVSYNILVDVSGLDPADRALALRPTSDTYGTASPTQVPLVSATITVAR